MLLSMKHFSSKNDIVLNIVVFEYVGLYIRIDDA